MRPRILADRFELKKLLSQTGNQAIYLACDRQHLQRPLCQVREISYAQREMRHRLERQAQILERLGQHPQISRVQAYFHHNADPYRADPHTEQPYRFYLVQDYLSGHSLSQEITPPRQLSESYVAKLLQDVLVPLAFTHKQGVVHQNLHPQHLFRQDFGGDVFLTEFGMLSKLARSTIQADGSLATEPVSLQPYLAPEQMEGGEGPQPASDLYALGLIAIEALTGRPHHDFSYDPKQGLRWRIGLEESQRVSRPMAEFIDRLVRHDWRDRFTNGQDALDTLREESYRHQIAQDSRLPTVVAAPGLQHQGHQTQGTLFTGVSARSSAPLPPRTGGGSAALSHRSRSFSHPQQPRHSYLFKLLIGSLAAAIALGIGVKTYQWGEYRLSRLPKTWEKWQPKSTSTYPEATLDELTVLLEDGTILLRPAAANAFWNMVNTAQSEGVRLYPLSGHRPRKDLPKEKAENSDYPTGYALDIGGVDEATDRQASFEDTKAFRWLQANASSHGFELSKPASDPFRLSSEEPWHWRYVGDGPSQEIFGIKDR